VLRSGCSGCTAAQGRRRGARKGRKRGRKRGRGIVMTQRMEMEIVMRERTRAERTRAEQEGEAVVMRRRIIGNSLLATISIATADSLSSASITPRQSTKSIRLLSLRHGSLHRSRTLCKNFGLNGVLWTFGRGRWF
jgi:hypothetical protein